MGKDDQRTLTPRLRFPEFRKGRAWEQRQAGELFTNRIEHGEDGLPIYSVTMDDGMVKRSSLDRKFDDIADSEGNKKVHKNDIAYNMMRMWQGAFGVAVEDCMVSPAYVVLAPQEGVSSDFFGRLLKTPWSLRSLTSQSHGLTKDRLRLYYKDFAQIPLPLPSLAEQQKIADCLTSLDELIAAQGRKVETLKAHKKGLMQQLFPREGETLPRLRFPEFRNAPEWEETSIGDMGEVITGSTPATSQRDYYGGEYLFVSPADISDLRFVESTKTTLTETGFAQSRRVKVGSVLFVCIGSTIGKVAQAARQCATNQQINSVVANSAFAEDFIYYLLHQESETIAELAGKQAVPIINKTLFSSVKLRAPTIPEQQRIADCLSTLDARIAAETEKLAALKTHKQGLMQQLFPSPEGMS